MLVLAVSQSLQAIWRARSRFYVVCAAPGGSPGIGVRATVKGDSIAKLGRWLTRNFA